MNTYTIRLMLEVEINAEDSVKAKNAILNPFGVSWDQFTARNDRGDYSCDVEIKPISSSKLSLPECEVVLRQAVVLAGPVDEQDRKE